MSDLSASIETLFAKMEKFVGTKTVVGEPIKIDEIVLIPLVELSFGVGAGAYDGSKGEKKDLSDAGAGGLGARISPSAVVAVVNGNVQLVNVKGQDSLNKLIDMAPQLLSKLSGGLSSLFGKKEEDKEAAAKEEDL
ncbi:MAG: sporulation protein [Clostridiales bacterium]|jgi:uncharacterized spore protein YtfJ|nr:sporulation protein [Clostridiales bacterium]